MKKLHVICVVCALASLMCACNLKYMRERRNRDVETLSASTYTSATRQSSARAEPHVIRLHVMVDASYRREHMRWRERIEEHVLATSRELRVQFNVALEITAIEEWGYDGLDQPLDQVLRDLRRAHPVSEREDRVLGFTASLNRATSHQHELGMAYERGEHMVLRGMQDYAERDVIEDTLRRSKRDMTDSIYRARLEHKRVTVLMHELGHLFGAMHLNAQGYVMSSTYDHKTNTFSPANTELLKVAFALDREYRGRPHSAWQRAFLDALRARRDQGDPLLAELSRADIDAALDHSASDDFERASTRDAVHAALRREDYDAAWQALLPRLDQRPEAREVILACVIQANLDNDPEATKAWCKRVLEGRKEETRAEDLRYASRVLANTHLQASEPLLALEYARVHEQALRDMEESTPEDWMYQAIIYQACGALSDAERAVALAGMTQAAGELRAEIVARRHYTSLFGVSAQDEPAIYQAVMALEPTYSREAPDAHAAALARLESLAPEAPATIVARCRVAIARGVGKEIVTSCEAAATRVPQSAMAHWGLGVAHFTQGKDRAAIEAFEHAITLEASLSAPWNTLARHYTRVKDRDALDALRTRYEATFKERPSW